MFPWGLGEEQKQFCMKDPLSISLLTRQEPEQRLKTTLLSLVQKLFSVEMWVNPGTVPGLMVVVVMVDVDVEAM